LFSACHLNGMRAYIEPGTQFGDKSKEGISSHSLLCSLVLLLSELSRRLVSGIRFYPFLVLPQCMRSSDKQEQGRDACITLTGKYCFRLLPANAVH
jgi:hypothetical protein